MHFATSILITLLFLENDMHTYAYLCRPGGHLVWHTMYVICTQFAIFGARNHLKSHLRNNVLSNDVQPVIMQDTYINEILKKTKLKVNLA